MPDLSDIRFGCCDALEAVEFVRRWHSRLPHAQPAPWQFAFMAADGTGLPWAAALWHNPSARGLPSHWLELRRLACRDQAPTNMCSAFLGWQVRFLRRRCPEREMLVSYCDLAVHRGTMYKAAGWVPTFLSKPRARDREDGHYRTDRNGIVAQTPKMRYQKPLTGAQLRPLVLKPGRIAKLLAGRPTR